MIKQKTITAVLGVILTAVWAVGQTAPAQERLKMRENVLTLRLLRLTQALELDEDQAARIYPMFNRIERKKLDLQKKMSGDIVDLRRTLREPGGKDEDLAGLLRRLKEAQTAVRALDEELEDFVEANLTTVQKAKYVLFSIEFYRGLADTLGRTGLRRGLQGNVPPAKIK